jgi:Uma2 family endonuclease
MSADAKPFLTEEQYLEIERNAETKSEFLNGEMFAMSGAQRAHNALVWNAIGLLFQRLKTPCQGFPSDMRVHIPATGLYTYPDLVVACGELTFRDKHVDTLLNPTLIIEVLSRSTEAYDRGRKFEHYRTIPSLKEYLLIASDRVRVDLHARQPDDRWLQTSAGAIDDSIALTSVSCELPLQELYRMIEFE